jgi:hypothetical protein
MLVDKKKQNELPVLQVRHKVSYLRKGGVVGRANRSRLHKHAIKEKRSSRHRTWLISGWGKYIDNVAV